MTFDQGCYLLGALGAELPMSANDATVSSPTEDLVKDIRLAGGFFKRYRSAPPMKHWQFSYSYLPGKRDYVHDGGLSRNDLWALYTADAEMSFGVPNDQGTWQFYTVRFVANSWADQPVMRNGDFWAWRVNFEILQTQAGPFAMNYSAVILREAGLLRYYRLGESAGVTLLDSSPNGVGGTYNSVGVTYGVKGALAGDPDTAVSFYGSTGYATFPAPSIFASDFTLECWFKTTSLIATEQVPLALYAATTSGYKVFLEINSPGNVAIDFGGGDSVLSPAGVVAVNSLYYLVGTYVYATRTLALYLNGVQVGSGAPHGPLLAAPLSGFMGQQGSPSAWYFSGTVDEVAIYNRALSAADVARHYAAAPVNLAGV